MKNCFICQKLTQGRNAKACQKFNKEADSHTSRLTKAGNKEAVGWLKRKQYDFEPKYGETHDAEPREPLQAKVISSHLKIDCPQLQSRMQ